MRQTGHMNHPPEVTLSRIERRLAQDTHAIVAEIQQAWESYDWTPLLTQTQAAAWARLLSFTSHLLGIESSDSGALSQAIATQTLLRWLQVLRLSPDDAIAWLLNPEAEPDPLLEQLEQAAIADVAAQTAEFNMQRAYHMRPTVERVACVRRFRRAFPVVNESVDGLPDWALADELPALHVLCLQEAVQQNAAAHAVKGDDVHPQQSRPLVQDTHQPAETRPVPGDIPGPA